MVLKSGPWSSGEILFTPATSLVLTPSTIGCHTPKFHSRLSVTFSFTWSQSFFSSLLPGGCAAICAVRLLRFGSLYWHTFATLLGPNARVIFCRPGRIHSETAAGVCTFV